MGLHISTGRGAVVLSAVPVVLLVLGLLASPYYLLAAGVAVGIFGLLLLMRYPQLAYYAIIAMVPFGAYRKPSFGGMEIKLDWIAAAVLLLGFLFHHVKRRKLNESLKSRIWIPIILFFGVCIASSVLSSYSDLVARDMQLLVVSLLLVMLTLFYVTPHVFTDVLPALLAGSIALSAFLGAVGYIFNIPQFAEGVTEGPFKRALGGTNDGNALAMIIVFATPLIGYLFFHAKGLLQRMVLIGMMVSCLVAMVLTFSRGGAMLLVVTISAFFAMHRQKINVRNVGLVMGLGGLFLAVVLCFIPQSYWERQRSLVSGEERSASRRLSYLVVAAHEFRRAPFLGHGPGAFPALYAKSDQSARFAKTPEDRFRRAHNTYAEVLVGSGLIGLVLFLTILRMSVRDFGRAAATARDRGDLKLAELIKTYRLSFVMLLIYIFIFYDLQNKHMLLCIGLSQVALRLPEHTGDPT